MSNLDFFIIITHVTLVLCRVQYSCSSAPFFASVLDQALKKPFEIEKLRRSQKECAKKACQFSNDGKPGYGYKIPYGPLYMLIVTGIQTVVSQNYLLAD